ncbi:hypothetical protein MVEN_01822400 [Mycena venus]|uniref:Uncharacterized protein n=1 Tax=Mycena venus TaxID=2733690 RepID=A0A8H6XJH0_9AGAR|nr:hypothetical protein MVEN_01822400 [Mycena venus]
MENAVCTLTKYADAQVPLSGHVREFSIIMYDDSGLHPELADRIGSALSMCINLRTLQLLMDNIYLSNMLRDAQFPSLRTLRYAVASDVSTILPAFINRHQTIATLGLVWSAANTGDYHLDTIQLSNLTTYSGDSVFLQSLSCDKTLQKIYLFVFRHEFEVAVERLGAKASGEVCELVFKADGIDTPAFLTYVAESVPQVTSLTLQRLRDNASSADRLVEADSLEIEMQLRKLKRLRVLEFDNFDDDDNDEVQEWDTRTEAERATDSLLVEKWTAACPSLTSILLHGYKWEYKGRWDIEGVALLSS